MNQQLHTKDGDNIEITARKDGTAVYVCIVRDGTPIEGAVVHANHKPAWNRGFQWGLLTGMVIQGLLSLAIRWLLG